MGKRIAPAKLWCVGRGGARVEWRLGASKNEEADNWFEEGEIEDDGIRRHKVEMSFAGWRLNRHPIFGKYRVKRVCETSYNENKKRFLNQSSEKKKEKDKNQ